MNMIPVTLQGELDGAHAAAEADLRRRTENRERRRTVLTIVAVWLVQSALFSLPSIANAKVPGMQMLIGYLAGPCLVGMAGALAVNWAVARIFRRKLAMGMRIAALVVIGMGALAALGDMFLSEVVLRLFFRGENLYSFWQSFTFNMAVYATLYALVALLGWSLAGAAEGRQRERAFEAMRLSEAEARGAANAARLAALRYQLNPHFLFNTLNSISSLVVNHRNQEGEAMIAQLAGFLRKTLAGEPSATHTLDQELETIDAYLAIERIRFGERLGVEVDCPPALREAEVPPFLLQPLVENAVKYGVASTDRTVTVHVEATTDGDDLMIAVEDDGDPDCVNIGGGTGIGLRNVRERLAALYGPRGRLETMQRERGYLAIVRIPRKIATWG